MDKAKLLSSLDTFEEGCSDLAALRADVRKRLGAIMRKLEAPYVALSKAQDAHVPPEGIFASDPDGDTLSRLEDDLPTYDAEELKGIASSDAWHVSRAEVSAWRKRLAK